MLKIGMQAFMLLMLILGVGLTWGAFALGDDVSTCDSNTQDLARGILVMGNLLGSMSLFYFVFYVMCGCTCTQIFNDSTLGSIFIGLLFIIGIIIIIFSAMIKNNCSKANNVATTFLALGIISVLLSIGSFSFHMFFTEKQEEQLSF